MYNATAPGPNYVHQHCQVSSGLNLQAWDRYRDIIEPHDPTLVDQIMYGFCMGANKQHEISIPYTNHKSAIEHYDAIDDFICTHYKTGAIAGPYKVNPLPVTIHPSPLQVATSASGKRRPVIDMSYPRGSSINSAIPTEWNEIPGFSGTFRLPTHDQLCDRVLELQDPVMSLTDLSAYYMQLPSDIQDYPYMVFSWRSEIWIHRRLPFGCRSACLHAQRVSEAVCIVFRHLSGQTYHVTAYVDDFPQINERLVASSAHTSLHDLLDELGLVRTVAKCLSPGDRRVCLGILYDMPRRSLCLPQEKLARVLTVIAEVLQAEAVRENQLQSLLGLLNHVGIVVPAGRPFNALMYDILNTADFPVALNECIKDDLRMWTGFLSQEFTRVSAMKRLVDVPVDVELAIAVKQNSCVIRCQEMNFGYKILSDWSIPIHLMPAVAVWLVTQNHMDALVGKVVCVSVPTKVAARVINRVSTNCHRLRPMLRSLWLRQAQADSLIKAVSASSNVGWLYGNYVDFVDVHFPY